jgi:hypothetical protein
MEPNGYPNPGTKLPTFCGTLLVVLLHISRQELLKTVVLAAAGAAASFAVSYLLNRLVRRWRK